MAKDGSNLDFPNFSELFGISSNFFWIFRYYFYIGFWNLLFDFRNFFLENVRNFVRIFSRLCTEFFGIFFFSLIFFGNLLLFSIFVVVFFYDFNRAFNNFPNFFLVTFLSVPSYFLEAFGNFSIFYAIFGIFPNF